ncbi:MAG: hypothetical protein OXF56_18565 [Rhodobacteraceae bacterium]|nr:hypothetical protein [Paracoccaceae bacterium]
MAILLLLSAFAGAALANLVFAYPSRKQVSRLTADYGALAVTARIEELATLGAELENKFKVLAGEARGTFKQPCVDRRSVIFQRNDLRPAR